MPEQNDATHAEYGELGELFAQIQADAEIRGTFFEGNDTSVVLAALRHYLTKLPTDPLKDFIDNKAYREELLKVINPSFASNVLDLKPTSSAVAPIYSKILQDPKGIALPCSIQRHAIVLEFVLEQDHLNISIYNTGLGINNHESQLVEGTERYRCCKRHRIDLSGISKDDRESTIKNIIDMVLPEGIATNQLDDKINSLYEILEDLVMIHPGSTIDNNDSSAIIGQRSGTCVWKSEFKYVREKVKAITKNDDLDLLLKYDIKLRSMQEFMDVLTNHPEKIQITKELIRTIIFTCQNNARLSIKLHSKGLITDQNLANALELYEQMYSLVPSLNQRLGHDKVITIPKPPSVIAAPVMIDLDEPGDKFVSDKTRLETEYPMNSAADCIKQLHALSEKIASDQINQDKYFVMLSEYIIARCADYLFDVKPSDAKQALQIVRDLHVVADQYLKCAVKDKQDGFSEVRNLTLATTALLANHYLLTTVVAPDVRKYIDDERYIRTDKPADDMKKILFTPLDKATTKRLILDPDLAKSFNKIRDRLEALKTKCDMDKIYLSFNSLKAGKLFTEAELLWWTLCLIEKTGSLANMKLESDSPELYRFLQCWFQGSGLRAVNSLDVFREYLATSNAGDSSIVRSSPGDADRGPTPIDRYTLGKISEVYSSGLLRNLAELMRENKKSMYNRDMDNSNFAYRPKGAQISRDEAANNLLQSMFAEEGISLIRLKEFIIENSHHLNNSVYTDLIMICVFKSRTIEKQLAINPQAVLDFLVLLKQVVDQSIERKDSYSRNAIFPISLYYQTVWYLLSFLDHCEDPILQKKIRAEIASTNFLPLINVKIAAIEHAKDQDKEEYGQLLALKHLHFKVSNKLEINLSEDQLVDLLTASMAAGMNASDLGYLSAMSGTLILKMLETIPADRKHEIANKLANNFVIMLAPNETEISDVKYNQQGHILSFNLGSELVTYSFDSGVAVIGARNLTKIPRIFKDHPHFKDSFDPPPTYCVVQNENQIRVDYKERQYIINLNGTDMFIQTANMQLYNADQSVNYYACKNKVPLTMLDQNHEILFGLDHVVILDKTTKKTVCTTDTSLEYLQRTSDSADLITNPKGLVYTSFANFEHPQFIETWQLADGNIELVLPRYGIVLRYNPNNERQIQMLLPQQASFSLLSDPNFSQIMPNGILLLDSNAQQRALLPRQYYLPQDETMKFDTLAASRFKKVEDEIYKPQLISYQNTEQFINFSYDTNKIQCATGDDYFSLAYYLLGQDEYALAKQYLYQGIAASTSSNSQYTWLYNIINFKPNTSSEDQEKINLFGTCHFGVRVLALYLFCCETDLVKENDKEFQSNAQVLLVHYYKNLSNIPSQFHLTNAQELKLLSLVDITQFAVLSERFEVVKSAYTESTSYDLRAKQIKPDLKNVTIEIKLQYPEKESLVPGPDQKESFQRRLHWVAPVQDQECFKRILKQGISITNFPRDFFDFYFSILECKRENGNGYAAMELKALLLRFILDAKKEPDSKMFAKWLLYILKVVVEDPEPSIVLPLDLNSYIVKNEIDLKKLLLQIIPNVPEAYEITAINVQSKEVYLPSSKHPKVATTSSPISADVHALFDNVKKSQDLQAVRAEIDDLAGQILQLFNIRPSLHAKAATQAAIKPKLTLEQIMQLFVQQDLGLYQNVSFMSAEQCGNVNKLIFEYLLKYTQMQKMQRNEMHLPRGYAPTDDPRLLAICLLFEKESEIGMYPSQVKNIKHILDQEDNPNAIVQMAMGEGKTTVMARIIAIANANGENLSIYVTPQSLYNTTLVDMSVATQRIFNKTPIGITFERNDLSERTLNKILQNIKTARLDRTFIIMSPETVHALYLSRIECAISGNIRCKMILDEIIMQSFKKHGVLTIDEVDEVLNLETENNYASMAAKSLDQKFPTMIATIMDFYTQLKDVALPYEEGKTFLDLITGLARKPKDDAEWSSLSLTLAHAVYNVKFADLDLNKEDVIACLLAKKDIATLPDSISEQTKDSLALFKFEISELFRITINAPYIEKYAATKRQAQQFTDLLAIPHSMSLPINEAEFSDPVTTLNYTIQSFLHNTTELSTDLMYKYRAHIFEKYGLLRTPKLRSDYLAWLAELFKVEDKSNFKLSTMMEEGFIARVVKDSAGNIDFKNELLRNHILPEIIENDFELQSSAYTFNYTFKSVSGFSGTLENPNMFHDSMKVANREQGLAIDQAIVDRLNVLNPQVTTASIDLKVQEQFQRLMSKNAAQGNNLHAIIDVGAAFKALGSNFAVAQLIAANVRAPITHVLYFQGDDLWALSVATNKPVHIPSTTPEKIREITGASPDQYFAFYDQAHKKGIDIRHAKNAHAILTLGEDTLKGDLSQGAMRMRGLKEGGSQTIEIFVTEAAKQRQPELKQWTWQDVLIFVDNNSIDDIFEKNFVAAQRQMSEYFQNKINELALASQLVPAEYVDKLKATKIDSLFERYGMLPQTTPIEEALQAYSDRLLKQAAQYSQINIDDLRKYCDKIIDRYKRICKAEVSTTVSAAQANTASFVSREKQMQQEQQKQQDKEALDDQHGVKAKPIFQGSQPSPMDDETLRKYLGRYFQQNVFEKGVNPFKDGLTWDAMQVMSHLFGMELEIPDPYKCRTPNTLNRDPTPFSDAELDKFIYCSPTDFTKFYYTYDTVSEQLENVTKNAYYIAVLKRPNLAPLHFLLSEESKDRFEKELSDFNPHDHTWQDGLPPGYSLSIFTKHNNLEFSTSKEAINLDPGILLRMHVFNADVTMLLDMLNGKDAAIVKYFFATQTQEKLKYLRDKVKVFRSDQSIYFEEFAKLINESIEARPVTMIFSPKRGTAKASNTQIPRMSENEEAGNDLVLASRESLKNINGILTKFNSIDPEYLTKALWNVLDRGRAKYPDANFDLFTKVVETLIEKGADVRTKKSGIAPLMRLIRARIYNHLGQNDFEHLFNLMLERKADINVTSASGNNILEWAKYTMIHALADTSMEERQRVVDFIEQKLRDKPPPSLSN